MIRNARLCVAAWTRVASLLILAGLSVVALQGGCRAVRNLSDRGHRILELPGSQPVKISGMAGAAAGYIVGLPFSFVLLPTYPFQKLSYPSSPKRDIPMPILFAPMELGSGVGSFITASPFILIRQTLDRPRVKDLSEWPPARSWPPAEISSTSTSQSLKPGNR